MLEQPGRELISLQPEAGHEEEGWLLSYLDVLTLLLTLFVLLLSLAGFDLEEKSLAEAPSADTPVAVAVASGAPPVRVDALAEAATLARPAPSDSPASIDAPGGGLLPGGEGLLPENEGLLPDSEGLLPEAGSLLSDAEDPAPDDDGLPLLRSLNLEGVSVETVPEGVALRIDERLLFASGRATLRAGSQEVLARLAQVLAGIDALISVEGHSDGRPIANDSFPSNWELSAARAASVLRGLLAEGLPAARLRAVGYADTRPIGDNATAAGRQTNRRVELVVSIERR